MVRFVHNNLPALVIALLLLLVGGILAWHVRQDQQSFNAYQHDIMQQSVTGASNQIAFLIDSLRISLSILIGEHKEDLWRLAQDPENSDIHDYIDQQISTYFPDYYAFTIADTQGEVIYDDLGVRIGDLCRSDILRFATQGHESDIYIHPGPGEYHFDVMLPWDYSEGRKGVFFVSFKPGMLVRLLRNSQVPGHELILLRRDTDDLIEISAHGGRNDLKRDIRLDAAELGRVTYSTPVRDSRWRLVDLPTAGLFSSHSQKRVGQSLMVFAGFVLVSLVMLLLIKREEGQRAAAEEAVRESNRALLAANEHKEEFLARMSHELRTPLNAIIGFSDVLKERMFGDLNDKQAEYIEDIHTSGQHLLALINDVLDLCKVDAGRMELKLSEFDLPVTLADAMTLVKERASRHGIAMELSADDGIDRIVADERKVKQVVLNLLSNAVKFTPDGGQIGISAHRTSSGIEIAVSDSGIGIPHDEQQAVFEEFRQVNSDDEHQREGTGLGLSLTRKFVELHNGSIWVQSEPGKGSTFTFTIPERA